jgi:hypothetical protein
MTKVKLDVALRLPIADLTALIQGRSISILPRISLRVGQCFALYPDIELSLKFPSKIYYSENFYSLVDMGRDSSDLKNGTIQAWAKCEKCQLFDGSESLKTLAKATIWQEQLFKEILRDRSYLFLAHLRVYLLQKKIEIPQNLIPKNQFIILPKPILTFDHKPVLPKDIFLKKSNDLQEQIPLGFSSLENLYNQLYQYTFYQEKKTLLLKDIQCFLQWSNIDLFNHKLTDKSNNWINKIADLGNYGDNDEWEKIIRKSLQFLGFKNNCVKLSFTRSNLTKDHNLIAIDNKMNVIKPETLEKLVKIKADFPSLINLFELKTYLDKEPFGAEANDKINQYIEDRITQVKIRSHIINLVKQLKEVTSETLQKAYEISFTAYPLNSREFNEILIEMSSPLLGYLGRIKGDNYQEDRFYFLRDLDVTSK